MTAPGTVQTFTEPDGTVITITWSSVVDGQGNSIGFTTSTTFPPGSPGANQQGIVNAVGNALAGLRAIQSQASTFQAQAPYATANLTNLNDLLSKTQTIAGAVSTIANDLIGLVRLVSNNFDGTT